MRFLGATQAFAVQEPDVSNDRQARVGPEWQTLAFAGPEKWMRLTQRAALAYVGAELDAPKKEGENDDQFLHRPNRSTKVSVRHQLTLWAIAALTFNSTAHSRLQRRLFSFS